MLNSNSSLLKKARSFFQIAELRIAELRPLIVGFNSALKRVRDRFAVIARGGSPEAIPCSVHKPRDCFVATLLAMTVLGLFRRYAPRNDSSDNSGLVRGPRKLGLLAMTRQPSLLAITRRLGLLAITMLGVFCLLLAPANAQAALTTSQVTGLTTYNQLVAPGDTLAVFGFNFVSDSNQTFNYLFVEIMGPKDSLKSLSSTAANSGLRIVKDASDAGPSDNGIYDSGDPVLSFETAPSWTDYETKLNIVDDALPNNDTGSNQGDDYFLVIEIKPADQITTATMFGFGIDIDDIGISGETGIPSSWTEAKHVFLDAGQAVINEVVTDPEQDWSGANFLGTGPGGTAN